MSAVMLTHPALLIKCLRRESEAERVVLVLYAVTLASASVAAPAVYTADTRLHEVDEEVGVLRLLYRLRVALVLL